jgi:hypothetical protein
LVRWIFWLELQNDRPPIAWSHVPGKDGATSHCDLHGAERLLVASTRRAADAG